MLSKLIGQITALAVTIIISILVVFTIINAGKWAYTQGYDLMSRTSSDQKVIVDVAVSIPQGATTVQIAERLKEANVIPSALYFRILTRIKGYDGLFQYGDYSLNTGMDEETIMQVLLTEGAKRSTTSFTIPEGKTLKEAAAILANNGLCTETDFFAAVDNINYGYDFIDGVPERNVRYQGYLFPSTYDVYTDASAVDIVSTMFRQFDNIWTDEFQARADELGMTMDEIITVASIIEAEVRYDAPDKNERALVASVLYNRLNTDMPLEMCSTVMYILGKDRDRLLYKDLEIVSPYNTYINYGLPEGPINSPGLASIEAALYPADSDYLYFVLMDPVTGEHSFNVNYNDHVNDKLRFNQEF